MLIRKHSFTPSQDPRWRERNGDDPIDMIFRQIAAHPARVWLPERVSPIGASNGRGTTSDSLAASGHCGRAAASPYRPTCVHRRGPSSALLYVSWVVMRPIVLPPVVGILSWMTNPSPLP
ncbi:hypothetical protein LZ32DRAFT_117065 [Colletotrichum eremochloae]|nr:hypothetical protein LZ32DRAFT_117065 [Colletotrichum eremochloae]